MEGTVNRTDCLINDVIERFEGGYTNHPADRGGPTNMGITRAALSEYLGRRLRARLGR